MRSCNWILAVKWKNKWDVHIMTTKQETVKRITEGSNHTSEPNCVIKYNKRMIEIDRKDRILACFPIMRKYMKGYRKNFFYPIDIGLFDLYILFNKINNGKNNVTFIIDWDSQIVTEE